MTVKISFTLRKMEETDGPEGVVFGHVADAVLDTLFEDLPRRERHHESELIQRSASKGTKSKQKPQI